MQIITGHPIKWAIVVFILLKIVSSPLVQPTVCEDGWRSSSIGSRGACSWHGGVATNWSALLSFWASVAGGFGVFYAIVRHNERKEDAERAESLRRKEEQIAEAKAEAKATGTDCPECGYPTVQITIRSGRNKRKKILKCVRYPDCLGSRDVDDGNFQPDLYE